MTALATEVLDELLTVTTPSPDPNKTYWQNILSQMKPIAPGSPALDGEGKPIPGARFVKRIIAPRDSIFVNDNPVRQVTNLVFDNVNQIVSSFETRGFDPEEADGGLVVARIPKHELARNASLRDKEFRLIAGFHRHDAQGIMANQTGHGYGKWSWFIVDEYEYDTPLAELTHAAATNCHWVAKSPSVANDIYVSVTKAIEGKMLPSTEAAIKTFVDQIAGHMTPERRGKLVKTILATLSVTTANGRQVRSMIPKGIPKAGLLTDPKAVQFWIAKMDLPVNQIQGNSYNDVGSYYSDEGSISKCVTDGMKRWINAGCPADQKIFAVFYVNTGDLAKHQGSFTALRDTRASHWAKATRALQIQYDVQFHMIKAAMKKTGVLNGLTDDEIMAAIKESYPIVLAGFLPQETSPDEQKGGSPSETTLVDADGNTRNIHQILGRV